MITPSGIGHSTQVEMKKKNGNGNVEVKANSGVNCRTGLMQIDDSPEVSYVLFQDPFSEEGETVCMVILP